MIIEWDQSYSVGIEVLDEQHRKLFDLLNRLADHVGNSENEAEYFFQIVQELFDYAHYHFTEEEATLAKNGYPDLAAHKEEHEDFTATVNTYRTSVEHGVLPPTKDVMEFLKNWLDNHIKISDKKYSLFMEEQRRGG